MPLSSRTVERDFPLMVKLSTVLYSTKAPSMLMFLTRVRRAAGGGGVFGAAGGGVAGAAGGGVAAQWAHFGTLRCRSRSAVTGSSYSNHSSCIKVRWM